MIELYLLHPVAVHFPIVLLTVGLAVGLWSWKTGHPSWAFEAASWLLWLGAASAWSALGLGLLAEKTAPHVPAAWQALDTHEDLAFWTAGVFTALSVARWRLGRKAEGWILTGWAAGVMVLLATAYFGGQLVFTFGMGVVRHGP